jgi:chaperonin cofactor prefoldin
VLDKKLNNRTAIELKYVKEMLDDKIKSIEEDIKEIYTKIEKIYEKINEKE